MVLNNSTIYDVSQYTNIYWLICNGTINRHILYSANDLIYYIGNIIMDENIYSETAVSKFMNKNLYYGDPVLKKYYENKIRVNNGLHWSNYPLVMGMCFCVFP